MTELAKHYDHRAAQDRCRGLWDAARAWHAEPPPSGSPPTRVFSIVIPPPNVTGALHLGHA
ncbi:MAG: class I tRNA ligase family protein, partial [Planctomycetes bacterium]|nr:class I tRNA ligase family protein [Planctomycetota bacterium]